MTEALLLATIIVLMYASFVLLALAQERHWSTVSELKAAHPSAAAQASWRTGGFIGLVAGFALCLWRDGAAFGTVLWILCLPLCAMLVSMTLAFKPRLLRGILGLIGG